VSSIVLNTVGSLQVECYVNTQTVSMSRQQCIVVDDDVTGTRWRHLAEQSRVPCLHRHDVTELSWPFYFLPPYHRREFLLLTRFHWDCV